ncbi:MAG: biotin/lipoyl-binding protein [Verrucomicrobia bacterium]|nr:biotin/lipoyl-binding protein [Verrucomicrobiota bacterium]
MKKIEFMLTAFRDGFQSVYGARVFSKDYLPCVEFAARECGITHFEAGGGALFQSPYFYSNENAFDVMDAFRKATGPDAELQTLARGISVVALKAQPRDVIKLHARMFKKHGMTTIRNFDALNDVQNLIWSGQCIRDAGLRHEVVVTLMELPPGCTGAHEVDFYETTLRGILDSGLPYDSVCFKDASGTARPQKVHETIRMARRVLGDKVKIAFHSHETAGTCATAYKAAIEAGADQIDLSLAPVSGGTSQPDVITMWHALRGTDYSLDVDIHKIIKLEQMFKEAMKDYFVPPEATAVEPLIPFFPMPGGALTANTQMLRDNGLMDKYPEVIAAMGEAVEKGGFGTSVTPVSQFYFQQAFNNVMFGPWKKIADGYGKMVLGYFGKTPVAPDPEVVRIASEQLKLPPTTDHLTAIEQDPKRGLIPAQAQLMMEGLPVTDENIFIVASCEEKGIAFLKGNGTIGVRKNKPKSKATESESAPKPVAPSGPAAPEAYNVELSGRKYRVVLDGRNALVNGTSYAVGVTKAEAAEAAAPPKASAGQSEMGQPMITQMPGQVLRIEKPVGTPVKEGDVVLVIESMKMENAIVSTVNGTVAEIRVKQGDFVQAGQELAIIR